MSRRRAVVVFLAVALTLATPAFVFGVYLPRFVTADGALDRQLCARSELSPPPPPGHLTVAIVDGLGFDYARALPELAWLREAGAIRPLAVEFPTYTTPALLSFVTGVGPRMSGVRLNAPTGAVTRDLDNLRAAAESVGRPIDFFDGGWAPFGEIMFTDASVLWRGRRALEAAPFVSRSPRSLRFLYMGDVDEAGHEHGEASAAFRAASVRVARRLERLFALLGPDDRLLVASDHGHLPSGGHGGVEPAIARATFAVLGRDARSGSELDLRPLDDVASTVAVLAGIPTPACNVGRPMLDMFDLAEPTRRALETPALAQRDALVAKIPPPASDGRFFRLAVLGLVVLGVGARARRHLPSPSAWLAPLALTLGYVGFLAARGYRLTFSKMPQQPDFIRDASIGAAIGIALALVLARRTRGADLAALAGSALPLFAMTAWVGFDHHVVPTPYVGLALILWSPTAIAASLVAAIVALRTPPVVSA